jgi:hypothetical protein
MKGDDISSRSSRLALILPRILAVLGAVMVFAFNPGRYGFYPVCPFHALTGLNCPGCGMTRSLHALLHADFLAALRDNALLVVGLIFVIGRAAWSFFVKKRGRMSAVFFPAQLLWPLLALAVLFSVLRNLPAFDFLSP